MAMPRIIARVSTAPTGDYGVLSFDFRGRTLAFELQDRASVDLGNELAGIVTILAKLEADERSERLILRPEELAQADVFDEEAAINAGIASLRQRISRLKRIA